MKDILAKKAEEINKIIYSFLPEANPHTEYICEAVSYSVKAGGKRLRPMLMKEAYDFLARDEQGAALLPAFMAGIEFIHTYSLVHDDLPAMDNDMYRRGQLTTHAKYGEAFGVLAGDALLNLAFEVMSKAVSRTEDREAAIRGIKALSLMAEKAGIGGMVGGQCADVYIEKHNDENADLEALKYIHKNKTAALLEASLMTGAVLAGAGPETVRAMEDIAENVGMAFQIRDDILDVISTQDTLGKPVGSDEKNGKSTYASILGIERSQKLVEDYSGKALAGLKAQGAEKTFLYDLTVYLIDRKF